MDTAKTIVRWLLCIASVSIESSVGVGKFEYFHVEQEAPYFSSQPKTYKSQVENRLTIICQVENLGSSTLIWKKGGRIISAGETIIRKDSRLSLVGHNLDIGNVVEEDAGEYVCEVETYGAQSIDQLHTVQVLVPPSVRPKPEDGKFVVRKGTTITLECSASGNPTPVITWTRSNNMLPSGEKRMSGMSIVIQEVTRHHSGVYICTADNGVGTPASANIDLQVLYSPEIEVDQTWIKTNDGIEAEVSCNVHAEPLAEVRWYKETMLLDQTMNRNMKKYGNRHVLVIGNMNEKDFGNYSCLADNSLGRESKVIEVSGRPHAARVLSKQLGGGKNEYNLTWNTDSFLPIQEYRILYRVLLKSGMSSFPSSQHTEWTNIIPTVSRAGSGSFSNSFTYSGSFNFFGLTPSTDYEVIIQSRNSEGWSDPTGIFRFSTRPEDFDPRRLHLQESDQQGYYSTASRLVQASQVLFCLILTRLGCFS